LSKKPGKGLPRFGVNNTEAAIVGIAGTLCGVLISQLFEIIKLDKASRIRQKEKIIDRRINAHELILDLADDLMTVVDYSTVRKSKMVAEIPRGPYMLSDKEKFVTWWLGKFHSDYKKSNSWLSNDCLKELNLFQDYLVNLNKLLEITDPTEFVDVSIDIKQDFIDFSGRLRKKAIKFLSSGALKLNLNDLSKWHKYPKKQTYKSLEATKLWTLYGDKIRQQFEKEST